VGSAASDGRHRRAFNQRGSQLPGPSDTWKSRRSDPNVEKWLPIAADVAVGAGRGDGGICLINIDDGRMIRHLNMSIASQSAMVAAGSSALIWSIANAR
jgi:hypothetical protein